MFRKTYNLFRSPALTQKLYLIRQFLPFYEKKNWITNTQNRQDKSEKALLRLTELPRSCELSAKEKMSGVTKAIGLILGLGRELQQKYFSMPKKQERSGAKRRYARISLKKRKLLVRMVTEEGQSIANTIKKLRLKLTTARLILQKYKETGTFPMRNFKKVGKMMLDLPEPRVKLEYVEEGEEQSERGQEEQSEGGQPEARQEPALRGPDCLLKVEQNQENSSAVTSSVEKRNVLALPRASDQ